MTQNQLTVDDVMAMSTGQIRQLVYSLAGVFGVCQGRSYHRQCEAAFTYPEYPCNIIYLNHIKSIIL